MAEIFIEAESFKDLGGWVIDQQSMETIHSSYIMAHGMGIPVKDAVTSFEVLETVDKFLSLMDNVKYCNSNSIIINRDAEASVSVLQAPIGG